MNTIKVFGSLAVLVWMAFQMRLTPDSATQIDSSNQSTELVIDQPKNASVMPTGDWLGGTQSREDLRAFKESGGEWVIRLNGDIPTREMGLMSIGEEKTFVSDTLGLYFVYMNIEGDVLASAEKLAVLLDGAKCLIHCRNGRHRAPAMMAWYLINHEDFDPVAAQVEVGCRDIVKLPDYQRYFKFLQNPI